MLQVCTNYEIGRRIFEQEQQGADRAGYGKELLDELAARLTSELGSGYSRTNPEDYPDSVFPLCPFWFGLSTRQAWSYR